MARCAQQRRRRAGQAAGPAGGGVRQRGRAHLTGHSMATATGTACSRLWSSPSAGTGQATLIRKASS
eukprot:3632945-Prymnesium_polylepis.1